MLFEGGKSTKNNPDGADYIGERNSLALWAVSH